MLGAYNWKLVILSSSLGSDTLTNNHKEIISSYDFEKYIKMIFSFSIVYIAVFKLLFDIIYLRQPLKASVMANVPLY